MKLLVQIVCILTFIPIVLAGQVQTNFGFGEGIITKKDSSSIKCWVELAVTYNSQVAYKMNQEGKEFSLKSIEIKSIQTPYKYIENITLDNKERLMAMVNDGQIRLFSHVTINPGMDVEANGGTLNYSASPTIVYALKKDKNYYELKRKDFKSKLSEFLSDQSSLVERINNDEFKFEEIEKIIEEYNNTYKIISLRRQVIAKVVDSETKKPIKDAKVSIQGTDIMTTSNFLGFIQITIDTIDTLLIEYPDYEIGQVKVPEANSFLIMMTKTTEEKE